MATLVCFHAHPDDESIGTAGVMAAAADAGHRVVLVIATQGEEGEVPDGFLEPGEALADRRVAETARSAEILGVARLEFLGYRDSGMMGEPTNDAANCFWRADVEEAAERLAAILTEEAADVLTVYDDNGSYGHPDHIQVHVVGMRAAELAGTPEVYEGTINRDRIQAFMQEAADAGQDMGAIDGPQVDVSELGKPEALLTTEVDVRPWIDRKKTSMRAHASQIAEQSFFLSMPDDVFERSFGTEWFIRRGEPVPVARRGTSII